MTWDRNATPSNAVALSAYTLMDPQSGSDGNCNDQSSAAGVWSLAQPDVSAAEANGHMMELCNESYLTVTPETYGDWYDYVHKQLAGTGIKLGAVAIWPSYCGSAYSAGGCDWIARIIAEIAKDNGNEPLATAAQEVDAWTIHPYASDTATYASYITSAHTDAVNAGSTAPWWITENGECYPAASGDSPDPGSCSFAGVANASTVASNLTGDLNDLVQPTGDSGTPFSWVTYFNWYAAGDDSSGDYGLIGTTCPSTCTITSLRPAYYALQTWMQQHASQTSG